MHPAPRVLVIQHEDKAPPGLVRPALERAGIECDVLPAHEGHAVPAALAEHSALIVLGGSMNAGDDADHRWLLPTKALIAGAVAAGKPFLGICLGHQLAAAALGGIVGPHPLGPARGLLPWGPTAEGSTDPLMGALPAGADVLHWNGDVVLSLPESARVLATAPDGTIQAVSFGARAWGVQFHPEVDAELVAGWAVDPQRHEGGDTVPAASTLIAEAAGVRELRERQWALQPGWQQFLGRFAALSLDPEAAPA